jgi:subtilase family serine protease
MSFPERSFIGPVRSAFTVSLMLCVAMGLLTPAVAQTYRVRGNTPGFIQKAKDVGPVDPAAVISVTAWLKLHNEDKLDRLVESQKQKGSANYQKWITQSQFNSSFGPTSQEVKAVQNFLNAHKLTAVEVAENNMYVKVQGAVADIQKTFHVHSIITVSTDRTIVPTNLTLPSTALLARISRR